MRFGFVIIAVAWGAIGHAEAQSAERAPGTELVGTQAKQWSVGPEWASSKPMHLRELRGRVVVVRFWTDTCPYCAASLPAMQRLAEELANEPVTFVGVYHSKPLGSEKPWTVAVTRAKELGVEFPIAYDHKWRTVRKWWLDGRQGVATSATFVIDPRGTIVFVHPGPVFYPSDDHADTRPNADYQAIHAAIRAALPNDVKRRDTKTSIKHSGAHR